jgi:predicted RNA-binding protein YlxR (DUF448 family)
MRRCIGCGRVAPKHELVRLAVGPQRRVLIDSTGSLPGRGAYLCAGGPPAESPAAQCLRSALRRGAIARSLRARVSLEPELVESVDRGEETRS